MHIFVTCVTEYMNIKYIYICINLYPVFLICIILSVRSNECIDNNETMGQVRNTITTRQRKIHLQCIMYLLMGNIHAELRQSICNECRNISMAISNGVIWWTNVRRNYCNPDELWLEYF